MRRGGVQSAAAGAEAQTRRDHEVSDEAQILAEPQDLQHGQPGVSRAVPCRSLGHWPGHPAVAAQHPEIGVSSPSVLSGEKQWLP